MAGHMIIIVGVHMKIIVETRIFLAAKVSVDKPFPSVYIQRIACWESISGRFAFGSSL